MLGVDQRTIGRWLQDARQMPNVAPDSSTSSLPETITDTLGRTQPASKRRGKKNRDRAFQQGASPPCNPPGQLARSSIGHSKGRRLPVARHETRGGYDPASRFASNTACAVPDGLHGARVVLPGTLPYPPCSTHIFDTASGHSFSESRKPETPSPFPGCARWPKR